MFEIGNQFKQEIGNRTEGFIVKEIKPFDDVLEFSKRIDPEILEKPFDLVIAELDRISFDLNQVHLKKSPIVFDLKGFEISQYSDFLIARNLPDGISYILNKKQGQRVSFVDGRFFKHNCETWQGYCLTNKNEFILNREYSDLDPNIFCPENLIANGELIKNDKRNIFRIKINENMYYVKSSSILLRPRYGIDYYDRFESFPEINKLTSKVEGERFLQLARLGINVPKVVGYSIGQMNDILVIEGINGVHPTEADYLENRFNIVEQDSQILTALTDLGLEKRGFDDFDDKVLRDGKLYLVDVDECILFD